MSRVTNERTLILEGYRSRLHAVDLLRTSTGRPMRRSIQELT